MAAFRNRFFLLIVLIITGSLTFGQVNHLSKRISISVNQVPVFQVLMQLSEIGNFNFSYSAEIFRADSLVTLKVKNKPVEKALYQIFGESMRYKVVSNHIIILPNSDPKKIDKQVLKAKGTGGYTITGFIFDSQTGERLCNATVYEVDGKISAFTNQTGFYKIVLPSDLSLKGITYCRYGYLDTVILIRPHESIQIDISLRPRQNELMKIQSKTTIVQPDINERKIVTWLVPPDALIATENLKVYEKKSVQVSILPFVGSNYLWNGTETSNISLNLLAGYTGGVDGIELGGLVNIVKNDVKGAQLAGWGNIVGNETRGLQAAGFFNINAGSVTGVQLAGFQNTLNGEMHGFQVSGFNNLTTQNVDGTQITGFVNVAFKDVKFAQLAGFVNYGRNIGGLQASGFVNVAMGNVEAAQLTGFVNYGQNIGGLQAAGFVNIAQGNVDAAQIAGFVNYCDSVTGLQLAGFVNVATMNVDAVQIAGFVNYGGSANGSQIAGFVNVTEGPNTGIQLAGFVNYATVLNGNQVSFLNICDTVESGTPIGFLSVVKRGYHRFEVSADEMGFTHLAFKTGTYKFYNIFRLGVSPDHVWKYTYGLGFKKWFHPKQHIDYEFLFSGLNKHSSSGDASANTFTFSPTYNYCFANHFTVGIGPSITLFNTANNQVNSYFADYGFHPLFENTIKNQLQKMWIGATIAIQI